MPTNSSWSFRLFFFLLVGLLGVGFGQSSTPVTDPTALIVATQSMQAMSGGKSPDDVTLTATISSSTGSQSQSGTANLWAKGRAKSRVELLPGIVGNRTEVRNASDGYPVGSWAGDDGVARAFPVHNCATDAAWFFPALLSFTSAGTDPDVALTYVGEEKKFGIVVLHLRSSLNKPVVPLLQKVSVVDIYIDKSSQLPVALRFATHPDNDAETLLPVEVRFSDYRNVSGVQVPFSVKKFVQGTLVLDISVQSVTINSGVPDSLFEL